MLRQLKRLTRYRWCPGAVIPPETRVDPSRFSEDEFPVSCPNCEYQLRGLTDNCCPECGRPFDRGRLLVEQYLLLRDIPLTATGKLARTVAVIGYAILIVGGICFGLVLMRIDPLAISPNRFFSPFFFTFLSLALMTLACSVIVARQEFSRRADRKSQGEQVFAALDWNEPGFARAQRLRFVSTMFYVLVFVGFFVVSGRDVAGYCQSAVLLIVVCIQQAQALRGWGPNRNKTS